MPVPTIQIDQVTQAPGTPGVSRDDLVLGQVVTLTAPSHPGSGFAWTLVARPTGSAAVLAGSGSDAPTFTPDLAGSYLVRCVADVTDEGTCIAAVKTSQRSYRIPAAQETTEFSTLTGWAPAVESIMLDLDANLIPQYATSRLIGRVTAGTGAAEALTGSQATDLLRTFTSSQKGIVPASGGSATEFLSADGTWKEAGGGDELEIGAIITGATAGAMFYGATSGGDVVLAQAPTVLFWDAGNSRLGLGTNAPANVLHVLGAAAPIQAERSTATTNASVIGTLLKATSSGDMADGFGPSLAFYIRDAAGATDNWIAGIAGVRANSVDTSGDLTFLPFNAGTPTEAMRLKYDGKIGMGTVAPETRLHVADATLPLTAERTTATTNTIVANAYLKATSSGDMAAGFGPSLSFYIRDTAAVNNVIASIAAVRGAGDTTGDMVLYTVNAASSTEKMRITSDGRVHVNALGTAQPVLSNGSSAQFLTAAGAGTWGIVSARAVNDTGAAHLTLFKTRATDPSLGTTLVNADFIGDISFQGVDSIAAVLESARIAAQVVGTVGSGVLPTDIAFYTTATNTASMGERMRIKSSGKVGIGTDSPAVQLDVRVSSSTEQVVHLRNTHASGYSALEFLDETGVDKLGLGYSNGSDIAYLAVNSTADFMVATVGNVQRIKVFQTGGNVNIGATTTTPTALFRVQGSAEFNALGTTQPTYESGSAAQLTVAAAGGNWGIVSARATNDTAAAHLVLFKTRATDPSTKTALVNADNIGDITWQGVDGAGTVQRSASITGIVTGTVSAGALPTDLIFYTSATNTAALTERLRLTSGGLLGIGMPSVTPQYHVDIRGGTNTTFHIRGGATTDTGGYIYSLQDSEIAILGGYNWNGSNFIAKATTASSYTLLAAEHRWASNTILTPSVSFTPTDRMRLYPAGGLELINSDSATVSLANSSKVRHTTTGQKLQISSNTGAYVDLATYAAALTAGSVPFADSSNRLAQDNANLFWNNSSKRLGIGTNSPTWALHVVTATAAETTARLQSTHATSYSGFQFANPAGTDVGQVGYGNPSVSLTHLQGVNFLFTSVAGGLWTIANQTTRQFEFGSLTTNQAYLMFANGASSAVSIANTGRLIYNNTDKKFQVSVDTGAYATVAVLSARQQWTAAQDVTPSTLTWGANVAVNAALSNTFKLTLTGTTAQLDNPTNLVDGQTIIFRILQDGTGGRALTFGTAYEWGLEGVPDLTTSALSELDIISAVSDGTKLYCTVLRGFTP